MNIHLYPVSFKKYSLILLSFFLFAIVIELGMEFYFEKLYGDLTRVGYFTERDFGWRSPQQVIPPELFKDYPLAEADILVIGDSFSTPRAWQTRLVVDGLKVATMHWNELGKSVIANHEPLPDNLGEALRAAGFKGRYLVIESIERYFQFRMETLSKEHNPIVKHDIGIDAAPFAKRERISLSKLNGANWGLKALSNSIKLSLMSNKYLKSHIVEAIKFDGCQLFSNRLCGYVLFVDEDFKKETFNSINNVLAANKNLQAVGIQPIWVIIPDKASIYLGYGEHNQHPYQNIWQQFAQYPELVAPDLGTIFTEKSRTIKDFYMPDDPHLSTNAYLYFGDFMSKELHKLQANQPNPFQ
ncbi:MAG: hypothetical protein NTW85_02245 [Methylococcales bacterium]|nr:hypothetical protein [Methylococcales bacterium]